MNLLDVAYLGIAAATSPWWLRKARGGWGQRFAVDPPRLDAKLPGTPRVMLHAVSVGEASALRTLVPMLTDAGAEVVVSCTTDTGLARAKALHEDRAEVVRYPLDASWAVRRFLDAVRPDVVGLVELELWPNFLRASGERGIPVAVINGRLSERSFKGYRRIARWMGPSFAGLSLACVQDEAYAERFRAMGTPGDRVRITGSMKFDAVRLAGADLKPGVEPGSAADELASQLGVDPTLPLVVGGSTGPGEEALLHRACASAAEALGRPVGLLCAPRRPERFDEAAAALPGCVRRSTGEARPGADRFVLDTIGELSAAYELAGVVVMGRSFQPVVGQKPLGGSDPIEPLALGRPVVFGPDRANFERIVSDLEAAGGLVVARDEASLAHEIERLLGGEASAVDAMVRRGRDLIRARQGASAAHRDALLSLASDREPAST